MKLLVLTVCLLAGSSVFADGVDIRARIREEALLKNYMDAVKCKSGDSSGCTCSALEIVSREVAREEATINKLVNAPKKNCVKNICHEELPGLLIKCAGEREEAYQECLKRVQPEVEANRAQSEDLYAAILSKKLFVEEKRNAAGCK